MPFFSVVIPLYNKEAYIADTLNSVLNQSFQDFEIIIVNDGSTDNSAAIVNAFKDPRITVFDLENQGASVARNYGIDHGKADYIALLDADDTWYENHLAELKKLIKTFPEAGLYCNNYEVKRNRDFITPAMFNFKFDTTPLIIENFFEASLISFILTSSTAFLKSTFKTIGGYNEALKTGQDIDLWIRMGLNYKVAFNPLITVLYNLSDHNSLSKANYNSIRYNFINAYKKEEQENIYLKKYLDVNRYALAIRCQLNDEHELYHKLKRQIDYNNLNFKQNLLIRLPKIVLQIFKWIQKKLIRKRIYLTAYN
ncbi:glycosyltransferase family 2 protein [Aestuariivivens sediminicola]|uniref:glycosyltransferase family 2 protein n=1 Tax=Aestuariivivens sediminicola TaxID=2913560 RepID=UPI001F5AFBCF|nr:glycosyltransferase family 2 protein [Aestuariivivens sediminicola]